MAFPENGVEGTFASSSDDGFQIRVKTLMFGLVTLTVCPCWTIALLKKELRAKVDDMFEGFDVELMLDYVKENIGLVYAGNQLNDEGTLQHYGIEKDSEVVETHGLDGGAGKRARGSKDDNDDGENGKTGNAITDMSMYPSAVVATDAPALQNVTKLDFDFKVWVRGLSLEDHDTLKALMLENSKYLTSDNTIRKYAVFVDEHLALEATHQIPSKLRKRMVFDRLLF